MDIALVGGDASLLVALCITLSVGRVLLGAAFNCRMTCTRPVMNNMTTMRAMIMTVPPMMQKQ